MQAGCWPYLLVVETDPTAGLQLHACGHGVLGIGADRRLGPQLPTLDNHHVLPQLELGWDHTHIPVGILDALPLHIIQHAAHASLG